MTTKLAKVTSKGQITLPKQIRDALSIRAGDQLEFSPGPSYSLMVRKMRGPGSSAGCAMPLVKTGASPLTHEQMKQAIRSQIKRKYQMGMEVD